jgi:uncharacterized RDD family membrane protein YckC
MMSSQSNSQRASWAHRILAGLVEQKAILWTLALLAAISFILFGARGMTQRMGLGILAMWLLAETILAWWWTIDTWREKS